MNSSTLLNTLTEIILNSVNSANADTTETRHKAGSRLCMLPGRGARAPGLAGQSGGGQLTCKVLGGGKERYSVLVCALSDCNS